MKLIFFNLTFIVVLSCFHVYKENEERHGIMCTNLFRNNHTATFVFVFNWETFFSLDKILLWNTFLFTTLVTRTLPKPHGNISKLKVMLNIYLNTWLLKLRAKCWYVTTWTVMFLIKLVTVIAKVNAVRCY